MEISTNKNGSALTICISGRLDTQTAPALEKTLDDNLPGATAVTFDLAGLTYTSSAGLRVFLKARKAMQGQDDVRLTHVCEGIMEILEMTGFTELMTVEKDDGTLE